MIDSLLPIGTSTKPLAKWAQDIRARTPARILAGSAGPSYRTITQLELRRDHASAVDAVHAEVDLARDFPSEFREHWKLFEVQTQAATKEEFLLRPDLGRRLSIPGREEVIRRCPSGANIQVVIGDGLSAAAVVAQTPALLPLLEQSTRDRGWRFGQAVFVRYCRVGVLNDFGEALDSSVIVLLIGERPGLATAKSLSAYMAFRPRPGHTDAQRNLISNIHERGLTPGMAAARILELAAKMRRVEASGIAVKEESVFLVAHSATTSGR
jgi:ethanolamine ammonia-lyase small subunit